MFYTVAAAAKATGLSKSTVLSAIEAGQVTGTKDLFGEWEIELSDLHRLYAIVGEPSVGIDGAQQYTARDAANLEAEIEVLIRDAGDSLRQSFDGGQYEPQRAVLSVASLATDVHWSDARTMVSHITARPGGYWLGLASPQSAYRRFAIGGTRPRLDWRIELESFSWASGIDIPQARPQLSVSYSWF